jgi:hypothetical protein
MTQKDIFIVALKIIGAWLIMQVLFNIVNSLFILSNSKAATMGIIVKTSLILFLQFVLGLYLLISGKIFINLAFRKK